MTLIELLIVVAIVGVLTSIGIWNYFIAIDRAKQKRTIGEIRNIALAWEAYATDVGSHQVAGAAFAFPTSFSYATLKETLVPRYAKALPEVDGWGHPLDVGYGVTGDHTTYAIRSRGKDGQIDANYDQSLTKNFACDIIYSNGSFVVYPENLVQ